MKQNLNYAVGVDFGGTSVKLALVDSEGRIKARQKIMTQELAGADAWLNAVTGAIATLKSSLPVASNFSGVGVGVPGFVDFKTGRIYELPNVPGWKETPLKDLMEKKLGVNVRIDNDVNAMALGECTFGSGRSYDHAVFVTLGTGVGGGLLINKKIYRGAFSMAGEIGHISIDMNGVRSPQGRGGLEQYVGNRRIVERTIRFLDEGKKSLINELTRGDRSKITPELIQQAATRGDALALEIFDFMADCLATAFASITYILQPQAFIIGGGVGQSGPVLFDPLRRHLDDRLNPHFSKRIELKTATLGNDAGMLGAAALVF